MNDFKTKIKPMVPIGRFIQSIFFGAISLLLISAAILAFIISFPTPILIKFLIVIVSTFLGWASIDAFKSFNSEITNYIIRDDSIDKINSITGSVNRIEKSQIKGFSKSEIHFRYGTFNQLIIYLDKGKKIELIQYVYSNFQEIESALIERGYHYLGEEPWYIGYSFKKRKYLYDK